MSNYQSDLIISVCFNDDSNYVETFQIPYDITWQDLEEMLKAQFDLERISVSYMDTDCDEISIGSQDELFAALRVAMESEDVLQVKVMPLAKETVVFRVHEDEDSLDGVPEHSRPDPNIAIPLPNVETPAVNRTDDSKVDSIEPRTDDFKVDSTEPKTDEVKMNKPGLFETCMKMVLPNPSDDDDDDDGFYYSPDTKMWEPIKPAQRGADEHGEPAVGEQRQQPTSAELEAEKFEEQMVATTDVEPVSVEGLEPAEKADKLLQYSDFVEFMTKLKKELRAEIVRDVTKKTVKHVLRGLDGAVIESQQGPTLCHPGVSSTNKGPAKSGSREYPASSTHEGVFCDSCNNTIVGVRYKCGNCVDFDLCEACENKPDIHNRDHVFVKIRRPCFRVGVIDGVRKPLLKTIIYRAHRKCSTKMLIPIPGEATDENELNYKLESKMKDMFARNEDKRKKKDEKKMEKLKRKEEKLKRRMEMRTEFPLKRERLELLDDNNTVRYDFYKVLMGAQFLLDITIPDATQLQSETKFVKTWKMKNDGDGPWSESTKLKLLWGNIPTPDIEVDVPHLKPGEEGNMSVDFVSPSQAGEYQSHWKLYEHGMQFGSRIWCSIIVVPRETLEPTVGEKDSLKVVMETSQKNEDEPEETTPRESIAITFRSTEEEHLKEVSVKREEKFESVKSEVSVETSQQEQEVAQDVEKREEVKYDVIQDSEKEDLILEQTRDMKDDVSLTNEGFVVYAKHDDSEPFEVENKEKVEEKDQSTASIADDLTSAVARLTLDSEKRDVVPAVSYTTTPNNTPFDVTPLKSPNPEPEDEADQIQLRPISNSSSVELVPVPDQEEFPVDHDHTYVQQRMASLELKPDIDLESISSYSDDDEDDDSGLSDSDYIIVPLPDCFDITKPLTQSFSSYSNSRAQSVDDDNLTISHRSSRALSVDDILTASSSIQTRPLSPTAHISTEMDSVPKDGSATSDVLNKGYNSDRTDSLEQSEMPGSETAEIAAGKKQESVAIMIESETDQPGGVSSPRLSPQQEGSTGADVGVSSPDDMGTLTDGTPSESGASGAASAQNAEGEGQTEPSAQNSQEEVTVEETEIKEPLSASAQMPENINYIKASSTSGNGKTVDIAPDFANQLVTTAVTAAGQAYVTVKAVFKTWQDNKYETKQESKNKSARASGAKQAAKWTSPKEEIDGITVEWMPTKEESERRKAKKEEKSETKVQWMPRKDDFKPAQVQWAPAKSDFTPPQSKWVPPTSDYKPTQSKWTPPKESEVAPMKDQWKLQKESGPMGTLFEMGFYDRALNTQLLIKYSYDVEKVIQELLSMKSADWFD